MVWGNVLVLIVKYHFQKHINIFQINNNNKNPNNHDKVQDLLSSMISIFYLSLKNSQRYDYGKKVPKGAAFFLSTTVYIHPTRKKMLPPLKTFFHLIISLSFLEFEWKILYHWKANILNFFIIQIFFLYFEDFLSYEFLNKNREFLNKNRVFFNHIKKYHFFSSYQKNFFVKTPSCMDYFAKKFLEKNVCIDDHMMVWIWVWFSDKGISLILLRF